MTMKLQHARLHAPTAPMSICNCKQILMGSLYADIKVPGDSISMGQQAAAEEPCHNCHHAADAQAAPRPKERSTPNAKAGGPKNDFKQAPLALAQPDLWLPPLLLQSHLWPFAIGHITQ